MSDTTKAEAIRLRSKGLRLREVAEALGIGLSLAHKYTTPVKTCRIQPFPADHAEQERAIMTRLAELERKASPLHMSHITSIWRAKDHSMAGIKASDAFRRCVDKGLIVVRHCGFSSTVGAGVTETSPARLTPAGWAVVGNAPLWVAA